MLKIMDCPAIKAANPSLSQAPAGTSGAETSTFGAHEQQEAMART
jgi:hypothetical protein